MCERNCTACPAAAGCSTEPAVTDIPAGSEAAPDLVFLPGVGPISRDAGGVIFVTLPPTMAIDDPAARAMVRALGDVMQDARMDKLRVVVLPAGTGVEHLTVEAIAGLRAWLDERVKHQAMTSAAAAEAQQLDQKGFH